MTRGVWSHVATLLARGAVKLRSMEEAHDVAYRALAGERYLVCKRLGLWYVLDQPHAQAARGNPAWPGRDLS